MRICTRLMLSVFLLVLVGCSEHPAVKDDASVVTAPVVTAPAPESTLKSKMENDGPVVTLLDAGTEPRKALRYRFNPSLVDTMVIEMLMSMSTKMDGTPLMDMDMPLTRMFVAIGREGITNDGNLHYHAVFYDTEVEPNKDANPMLVGPYQEALEEMVGMQFSGTVTDRGFQTDMELSLPEGVSGEMDSSMKQMEQTMQNMSAPFPVEEVGVGARWSVFMPFSANGINGSQTTTYEVKAMHGDQVEMVVSVVQDFPNQEVASDELPAGTTLELTGCDSTAHGFLNATLNNSLMTTSGMVSDMEMFMAITTGGVTQNMSTAIKMDMKMMSKK